MGNTFKYLGFCILLLSLPMFGSAQQDSLQQPIEQKVNKLPHKLPADTLVQDSADQGKVRRKNPKRAAVLSAVLPGSGQIYNRKYWKLPIVYGGLGTTVFLYFNNRYWYQEYRTAYLNDLEEDSVPSQYALNGITTSQLREAADASRKNMEYAMIGTVIVYALQIVDATVDAHLFYFDVSDDLSMNWTPSIQPNLSGGLQSGISLNLNF